MRLAVIDMGTNSTRLLVAVVKDGRVVEELERESRVTRLGRGVDLSDQLAAEAIEETCVAVGHYVGRAEGLEVNRTEAIATSAVRDASNSDAFIAELRERFGLEARTLHGAEEARLTYLGAIAADGEAGSTLVVDIGGGSTEVVLGSGPEIEKHVSLQIGAARHSERHLREDPPSPAELEHLAASVREAIDGTAAEWSRPPATSNSGRNAAEDGSGANTSHPSPPKGIAVAGTATSLAAIDLVLEPYDPDAVEGHVLPLKAVQRMCSELSALPLAERQEVTGLHPDRAPTIVAGTVILIQAMRAFGLAEVTISERDLLHGAALEAAAGR